MRKFGIILGLIIAVAGLSIMVTPLRMYFIVGWLVGCVFLVNGFSMFVSGFAKGTISTRKRIIGAITALIGIALLVTDLQKILTQIIIVNLISGGIMFSGIIEFIFVLRTIKRNELSIMHSIKMSIYSILSILIGITGLVFKDYTVIIIGMIVGYNVFRTGMIIFSHSRKLDKPIIID